MNAEANAVGTKAMTVFYMGLEKLESRYTHQLTDWNIRAFNKQGVDMYIVDGQVIPELDNKIVTGSVLDVHGRTHYSLTQHAKLVRRFQEGRITSQDVIFYEDMFTPGIEALPYMLASVPKHARPKIFVRCLAQTIDPDDFVHRTGMFEFMRAYELMVDSFVDGILCASEEMVANLNIAGFKAPKYVTGLPFGKAEVQERMPDRPNWRNRPLVVSFASRWDSEKQPGFFLDLIQKFHSVYPGTEVEFQILTGFPELRSDDPFYVKAAEVLEHQGLLKIKTGLTKNEYYSELCRTRVLFNCALQDWVSNTVSEADALGCQTLFPAYRSFPEVFGNDPRHMYLPWSVDDAMQKLEYLLINCVQDVGRISDYQDGSIRRTLECFLGTRKPAGPDYRSNLRKAKL